MLMLQGGPAATARSLDGIIHRVFAFGICRPIGEFSSIWIIMIVVTLVWRAHGDQGPDVWFSDDDICFDRHVGEVAKQKSKISN
jgi:hypothetical protein